MKRSAIALFLSITGCAILVSTCSSNSSNNSGGGGAGGSKTGLGGAGGTAAGKGGAGGTTAGQGGAAGASGGHAGSLAGQGGGAGSVGSGGAAGALGQGGAAGANTASGGAGGGSAGQGGAIGGKSGGGGAAGNGAGGSAGAHAAVGGASGNGGGGNGGAGAVAVTIQFKATVGTAPFACGVTYTNQGSTGVAVRPRDFRFYVQSVRLIDGSGQEVPVTFDVRSPWQTADVALLDFEDGSADCVDGNSEMNTTITGTVPAGSYNGVVFTNGVPDALNHGDPLTLPAPLQAGAMTWGWLYGFKFVKAELGATATPAADAGAGLGLVHLGSIGCDNSVDGGMPDYNAPPTVVCSQPDRNEIRLVGADPTTHAIVADVGAIFAATDLSQDQQCHSAGDACPSMFWALGLDFATGATLPTQTVYHVE